MAVLKGVHAQVPPHLILPCFRKVIGRATVRCACEEMMICSGCVGPCVPLWAKCPLYRLFQQPKGICLASQS